MNSCGTVGIIGAGSSGLVAAKNFRGAGFSATIFEQTNDLGGNWNYDLPVARVYRSTHTISSKPGTEYPDFPMPHDFPDYPHHTQILSYLRAYATRFDLLDTIRFGSKVGEVVPLAESSAGTDWCVTLQDGGDHRFDMLVVANGHNWSPKYPTIGGTFDGTAIHSAEYRTPDLFVGKRVLVIGGGNSGCDIVVEAAQNGVRAFHSTRRGYWYMPKYLLGRPSDQVGDAMLRLRVPLWLRRGIATISHRLLIGSPEATGLPRPDHKLFETHPVVNSLLPYYVGHGDIKPKPDVERFEGNEAVFVDGSREPIDIVVFATGYNLMFPFLDPRLLDGSGQQGDTPEGEGRRVSRPQLHLNVFHPVYDTLFFAGLIQPDSGQFGLVHWQTMAAARFAASVRTKHPSADYLRNEKRTPMMDLGGGVRYKASGRHALEVEHWSYQHRLKALGRHLGASQ